MPPYTVELFTMQTNHSITASPYLFTSEQYRSINLSQSGQCMVGFDYGADGTPLSILSEQEGGEIFLKRCCCGFNLTSFV